MTLIDYICIGVLAVFVIVAAVRGFAKIILHLLAYIAAGLGARYAAIPLAELIYKMALHEPIREKLLQLFPSGSIGGSIEAVLQAIKGSLSESAYNIADFLHLLPDGNRIGESFYTVETIEETFLQPIITKVLLIITTVVLFVVFMIILNLIVNLLDKHVFKKRKGAVNVINRILGGVTGLVQGAIPVAVGCLLLNLIAPLTENSTFSQMVSNSCICSYIAGIF